MCRRRRLRRRPHAAPASWPPRTGRPHRPRGMSLQLESQRLGRREVGRDGLKLHTRPSAVDAALQKRPMTVARSRAQTSVSQENGSTARRRSSLVSEGSSPTSSESSMSGRPSQTAHAAPSRPRRRDRRRHLRLDARRAARPGADGGRGGAPRAGLRQRQVRVLAVDTDVHAVRRVSKASQVALAGGGGTDMGAGIAAAAALRPRPSVTIVLTDGYTPWPERPPAGMRVVVGLLASTALGASPDVIRPNSAVGLHATPLPRGAGAAALARWSGGCP